MTYIRNIAAAALVAALHIGPANAGGLFGEGGLIRGDVGRALDPVENRVLTPTARRAVEMGAATFGGFAAGAMGAPPAIGSAVGRCWGRSVNSVFAGNGAATCFGGRAFEATRGNGPMGNRCATRWGVSFPGPWNPLGSPCWVGNDPGHVVR